MDGPSITELAYAPPQSPEPPSAPPAEPDHERASAARLAGIFLLVDTGIFGANVTAQILLGVPPWRVVFVQHFIQIGIGVGLLRMGRKFTLPALAFVAIRLAVPIVGNWSMIAGLQLFGLLGALVGGVLLSVLPTALLLVGTCGRTRRRVAMVLFVVYEVLVVVAGAFRVWTLLDRDRP